MDSAIVDFRTGVVGSLPHDGDRRVARVATRWMGYPATAARGLRCKTYTECRVAASFLWPENAGPRLCRNPAPARRHRLDRFDICPRLTSGGAATGAIHRVGDIRIDSELHALAA